MGWHAPGGAGAQQTAVVMLGTHRLVQKNEVSS
jgi:hypothetical protein